LTAAAQELGWIEHRLGAVPWTAPADSMSFDVPEWEASMIDKQWVAAIKKLEELGYTFAEGEWMEPGHGAVAPKITDTLHTLLVKRADELDGCTDGSDDERELAAISDAIEAYETVRWPKGRVEGGKG
jgi:hypothetical protein